MTFCANISLPPTQEKKRAGRGSISQNRWRDLALVTPTPEKDDKIGLLAWPATTFLTLHRQETKSLETKGRGWEGGSSDQERRKHTGLMGGGGEEQPIYPDL